MSVIIVSSDSPQTSREIARSTADALGYRCLGRELLEQIARRHDVPREKLTQVLDEPPPALRSHSKLRHLYLAYIQEGVISVLVEGDVVCEGLAAHLYVLGVSHVLKVRMLASEEQIVQETAAGKAAPEGKATKAIARRNKAQQRWSLETFQRDETDPSQYDLVINLGQIDPDAAVRIIAEMAANRRFRPMTYSIRCMQDLALVSSARTALLGQFPDIRVRANRGSLVVETTTSGRKKQARAKAIKEIAGQIPGVEYVEVHVITDVFHEAARSFR